ncbi:hypothetical protein GCM10010472_67620 [Pseudonocardia halophobica]|uniref:DUF5134 domain-containing protein n=1 Tax=Pseudonocardia halophobica TaxID=29401 RepID=A0A9W6L7U6_9PSEU|nr:DUF5134 domain-containing protein [Pseudonocardia halophobica]GLL12669.1 hypothetical protein GCM10017577_38100 [Pseudonocardia halophobica]
MAWFDAGVSAVLVGVGLLHVVRLVTARRDGRPAAGELAHVAMALGMASMFSPTLDPLPSVAWSVLFGLSAAWFTAAALRDGPAADDAAHHVVCGLAMLFMLVLSPHGGQVPSAGHSGHGAVAGVPIWVSGVSLLLVGYFAWHGMRCGDRWACAAHRVVPHLPVTVGGPPAAAPCAGSDRVAAGARLGALRTARVAAVAHLIAAASMAVMLLGAI